MSPLDQLSAHTPSKVSKTLKGLRGRSFISTGDFSPDVLHALVELAIAAKNGRIDLGRPLSGKSMALVFMNPSLRTRLSMGVAVNQLGGMPFFLDIGQGVWKLEHQDGVVMDGEKTEHIKEAIPVLARYADVIGVRSFPFMENFEEDWSEPVLTAFQKHARVPVVSMESSMHHPCQALGDMMTIQEKLGGVHKKKILLTWAFHPKALPLAVPNSFALAASQFGADLTIACPEGFDLPDAMMSQCLAATSISGGSVRVVRDPMEAFDGQEIVYAKSWMSPKHYGNKSADGELRSKHKSWCVTEEKMDRTHHGRFMHCLPVRRNVVVSDGVLDGPRSIVVDEAENRLHIQKAILASLVGH